MADRKNLEGLTYEAWLALKPLPENFKCWPRAYRHWEISDPIDWAIHVFNTTPQYQHEAREVIRKAAAKKRETRK